MMTIHLFTYVSKVLQTQLKGGKKVRKSVNGHSEACVLSKAEVKIATDIFLVSDLNSKHHTLPLYVSCNLSLQEDGKNVLNKNN